ncbi:MAG: 30S ribosomal protein S11 [Anaerolineales bacterium]|nr:30S ribosomal protein S11 [Anaerolineales bacterium]MBS3752276.1 30S ribosomal protein S11 [Anaerolineales bacterium]
MAQQSKGSRQSKSRSKKKKLSSGQIHVRATFNNTIVTVTDNQGNTVCWSSPGTVGLKGSRRSTSFAARLATEDAVKKAMGMGLREADALIRGPGPGREASLRAIESMGLKLKSITDVTSVPHNGCRPPKKRRV